MPMEPVSFLQIAGVVGPTATRVSAAGRLTPVIGNFGDPCSTSLIDQLVPLKCIRDNHGAPLRSQGALDGVLAALRERQLSINDATAPEANLGTTNFIFRVDLSFYKTGRVAAVNCRKLGPGGPCPHCDEPVVLADLLPWVEGGEAALP